jgi:hypothetical protein
MAACMHVCQKHRHPSPSNKQAVIQQSYTWLVAATSGQPHHISLILPAHNETRQSSEICDAHAGLRGGDSVTRDKIVFVSNVRGFRRTTRCKSRKLSGHR